MVNNSYICGAETSYIISATNTDLGGVSWLHISGTDMTCFCKNKWEHRFLCTY